MTLSRCHYRSNFFLAEYRRKEEANPWAMESHVSISQIITASLLLYCPSSQILGLKVERHLLVLSSKEKGAEKGVAMTSVGPLLLMLNVFVVAGAAAVEQGPWKIRSLYFFWRSFCSFTEKSNSGDGSVRMQSALIGRDELFYFFLDAFVHGRGTLC
jgi:hypothetical protein